MPVFASIQPPALYAGDSYALVNNAASDTIVHYTQQVVTANVAQSPGDKWTLTNTTNQTATIYAAAADAPTTAHPNGQTANYEPLTNADTNEAISAATNTSITFSSPGPFICAYFATAPNTGSLVISR